MASKDTSSLKSLKVALVHDSLTVPGGAEKVLYELWQMFPNATIYTPLYKPENFPEFKGAKIVTSALSKWSYARNHHQVMIPLLPYCIEQFDLSEFDLVISDSTAVAKGALTRPETLHICYCHTPMRWAWLPFVDKRASSSLLRRLAAHYLRLWDSASVPRVDVWLANSKTSAARVKKFYGREAQPIYPPIYIESAIAHPEHDNFYLTVGRLIPGNKRTDILIEAAKLTGITLKIAGDGPLRKSLEKQAAGAKNIEFLGFVSDKERDTLYQRCKAFLFASEEDSGIVPIEAMAYGKPVIAFSRGGAGETVLDKKTGLHFHEQTPESLAQAIKQFETMSFDAKAIAAHAQHFSAERFRLEIKQAIETAYKAFCNREK